MADQAEVDRFVTMFGGEYRRLIESALDFLDENEPKWGLRRPVGRLSYMRSVMRKVVKHKKGKTGEQDGG